MGASSAISIGRAVLDPSASLSKTGKEPIKPSTTSATTLASCSRTRWADTRCCPVPLALTGIDIEGRDSRVVAGVTRCGQGREAGLPLRRLQQALEVAVDVVQNGRARPEVGRDSQDRGGILRRKRTPGRKVRLNVRARETDRSPVSDLPQGTARPDEWRGPARVS